MDEQGWIARNGFWPLALLWLPAGVVVQAAVRFGPGTDVTGNPHMWPSLLMSAGSLASVVPCGLPLALGCRRLWRLGYRRGAWTAGVTFGAVTVMVTLLAGLLGPLAMAVCAVAVGLPVWIAWWWLAWRG